MYFRATLLSAFFTALIATIPFSVYQELMVTPIILDAETFELPEATQSQPPWAPEDGIERSLFTLSADFLTAFAFSLMLISAMATQRKLTLLQGLGWGIAGYLCFFVAPALGLPPEIPGMETSSLVGRQLWWLIAVIFTAAGLWLVVFAKIPLKTVGIVILIAPHLLGAPNPETHGFANPDPVAVAQLTELWHQFILQTSIANALLWLIIGEVGAVFTRKWILSLDQHT